MMRYTTPVVQEAICFVGFEASVGGEVFSSYYNSIQREYPTFAPLSQQTITLNLGPDGPLPPQHNFQQVMRYTREDHAAVITLSLNSLALHILKPYPGWEQVKQDFEQLWRKLVEIIKPTVVTQIALRYINVIPCRSKTETLSYWLKANDFIPEAVLQSYPFAPCQVQRNKAGGVDVTKIALNKAFPGSEPYGVFIWEIEQTQTRRISTSVDEITQIIGRLHEEVSLVFYTAIGSNLEDYMKGEAKQ